MFFFFSNTETPIISKKKNQVTPNLHQQKFNRPSKKNTASPGPYCNKAPNLRNTLYTLFLDGASKRKLWVIWRANKLIFSVYLVISKLVPSVWFLFCSITSKLRGMDAIKNEILNVTIFPCPRVSYIWLTSSIDLFWHMLNRLKMPYTSICFLPTPDLAPLIYIPPVEWETSWGWLKVSVGVVVCMLVQDKGIQSFQRSVPGRNIRQVFFFDPDGEFFFQNSSPSEVIGPFGFGYSFRFYFQNNIFL